MMRRIWAWLDNSSGGPADHIPVQSWRGLADISPWFLILAALSALLWIPYVTGVAHLILRAGDWLGRMLAMLTALAFTMIVAWCMLSGLLSWPFWPFLIGWPVMILLECCGLIHANHAKKKRSNHEATSSPAANVPADRQRLSVMVHTGRRPAANRHTAVALRGRMVPYWESAIGAFILFAIVAGAISNARPTSLWERLAAAAQLTLTAVQLTLLILIGVWQAPWMIPYTTHTDRSGRSRHHHRFHPRLERQTIKEDIRTWNGHSSQPAA